MNETATPSLPAPSLKLPGLDMESALQVLADSVSDCTSLLLLEKESAMSLPPNGECLDGWRNKEIRRLNDALERRVAERTAELEAANKDLEVFAYSVSHDLRAPLRHVEGFLANLSQHLGPDMDMEAAHCLDRARAASQRMGHYIDALLQFSRLGRQALRLETVDLDRLVADLVEDYAGELGDRQVAWTVDPLPRVQGDANLVRAVFQNLIGNAVKFTGLRGQAEIQVGTVPGEPGERVVFVRDNGAGFDPAYAANLFGVFQRLHRADEFEGLGIGLANVHRIVTRHGGRIWADGRPGQGATFFVAWPKREA